MSQVPPAPRPRRLLRRIAPAIALAAVMLVVTQVVLAAPPTTTSLTITPDNTPEAGQERTFTAVASDPDSDIVAYEWDFDYNGPGTFTVEETTDTNSTTFEYDDPGSRFVAVRAVDAAGDPAAGGDGTVDTSEPAFAPIHVSQPNRPPEVISVTNTPQGQPNGDVPHVGQAIRFTGSASDLDNDNLTYTWDFGDGNTAGGSTVDHAFSSRGDKTVTLSVSDGTASDSASQQVRINALPVASINVLNEQAESGQKRTVPLAGQAFAFTSVAVPQIAGAPTARGCPSTAASPASPGSTDAEDEPEQLTYAWDLDNNGTFETPGASAASPPNGYPAGDVTVGLQVTDADHASVTLSRTFRVNAPPTAGFVYEPFTPIINQDITFSSTSFDLDPADAGKLRYSWDLNGNGTFCEAGEQGASVKARFAGANTSPGHTVRLKVTDDGGITREVARNVIVQNTLPTASIGFAPDAPLPGQPVTFSGSASSPTGKAISGMQWDFDFDPSRADLFDVDATGASAVHAFSGPGPKTVGLKVFEEGGGFAIVARTINVNAAPRSGFTVAPADGFVGEPVTLSSTSADPDGPLVKQEWDLDNDGQFDDANAAVVSATFNGAGTHPLKLRVTDSRGATAVSTGQVTLRSRPLPVLTGVVISMSARVGRESTRVTRLLVRAPRGSRIVADCVGKRCPKRLKKASKVSKRSKRLRFKKLERKLRPRVKLVVTVTRNGFIGKRTTYKIRRRKDPRRRDLCLVPGAKRASECPPE